MNTRAFLLSLSCLFLVVFGGAAAEPPEVPVARPVVREVTDHEDFTGRTEAAVRVDLRARVTGYLLKATFQDGAEVKEGDVLFEIDARPYRAELDRAEAALAVAVARLRLAEANHKRAEAAHAKGAVSREELDKAVADRAETEAGIRLAQAGRELTQLNLAFTRVHAPVGGTVGRRLVDPGNLVKADETLLATLITRDPVHAYFDVDERTYLRLRRSMTDGKGKAGPLPVAVGLADEEGFPRRGVVDFADNRVDPDTGTLRVRAVLPNKDGLLLPGMFVRVRLPLGEPHKVLLVPAEAVRTEGATRFVFVVNDKDVIERRPVVLGQIYDGRRAVQEGLKAEERVVTGRAEEVRPGMTVRPRQGDVPDPKPERSPDGGGAAAVPVRGKTGPGILVETVYPGASTQVVADAVRLPIEQQVSGLEKIRYMRSRCTSDGKYTLAVTFARGVDLKMAQVLVQNRVSLAAPQLPNGVQAGGVNIKQGSSGVLLIVTLSSPGGDYDRLYLSNYASIQIKDELARVSGVGDVTLLGQGDHGLRVALDPDKLAALGLNAGDVNQAIEKEKDAGELDLAKLPDLIVKADGAGRVIRLRDVAAINLTAGRRRSEAALDGKPVAALVLHPTGELRPQEVRAALLQRVAALRSRLPQGLQLDVAFDFTANLESPDRPATPEYLLLDPDFPAAATAEHGLQVLGRCEALLRQAPGVEHVLTMSDNPFDLFGIGPCLLVRLTPAETRKSGREEIIRTIRTQLGEVKEMTLRLRDLSGPGRYPRCGYPIDLAVWGAEPEQVQLWARKLGERLGGSKQLTDVWVSPAAAPRPQRVVEVDRAAAAARGVSMEDILQTLRLYGGTQSVTDFHRFGRTWRVEVQAEAGDQAKDLRRLKVRNARGQMVPLGALVAVRETEGPQALDFLDLWPMVQITANPASGTSIEQARKLCETVAEAVRKELRLPAEYRLTWLQ